MPNRILREGILDSRAVNSLSEEAELFYRRLMSVVDDYGRCEADPEMLRLKCFPRRLSEWTVGRLTHALHMTVTCPTDDGHPLVTLYEVGSKKYLQINNFNQRIRAGKSKCPSPDGHMTVICPPHDGHVTAQTKTNSETKSKSKTEAETQADASATSAPEDNLRLMGEFDHWIAGYPNQVNVEAARQAWAQLVMLGEITAETIPEVFAGLERWKRSADWADDGGKYIHRPVTFLIGGAKHPGRMWRDRPRPAEREASASSDGRDPYAEWVQPEWKAEPMGQEEIAEIERRERELGSRANAGR